MEKDSNELRSFKSRKRRRSNKFLDSSVKKLFILAIVKGIPETRENVKTILKALKLENVKFDFCLATDMKLQNITVGIQANSSKHPCAYCEAPRPFDTKGMLRTLGRLRQLCKEFHEFGGGKKENAKDYCNVVHEPLIDGDDETLILLLLPIPELHLLLGIGNN